MEKAVLLGFIEKEVDSTQILSWNENRIGGNPSWTNDCFKNEIIKCKLCGQFSAFITQINCPLGQSVYHRVFYIFCCINSNCWNKSDSWSVIRCQIKDETFQPIETKPIENKSENWLPDADSWCDEDSETSFCSNMENMILPQTLVDEKLTENHLEDEEQEMEENEVNVTSESFKINPQLTINLPWLNKQSGILDISDAKPIFKPFYLTVIEEPLNEIQETSQHIQKLINDYQSGSNPFYNIEGKSAKKSVSAQELYEKSDIKHGDKMFYKFCKRVNRSPTQVIRYCWEGKPLCVTDQSQLELSQLCQYCGSSIVFEFQLMPALISHLKLQNSPDKSDACIEYGTVLIFSCQNSCWNEGSTLKYETVYVQADPYEDIFNMK